MPSKGHAQVADTLPLEDSVEAVFSVPLKDHVEVAGTPPPEDPVEAVPAVPSKGHVEVADTLPPEDSVEAVPATAGLPAAGPPVARWDHYEVLELLGKGGMGVVYKARDLHLDRTIAIKFLLGAHPNLRMRFVQEARAQSRIDHPNVCRVYTAGEVNGHAYIALQLVHGEPLHKAAARMSLDEKIAVMRDVALAIQEAHGCSIVHRDLKPANIMVERTDDGRWFPIVMDFGLAREATVDAGITASGALLGTPAYMSPEQARGDSHAVGRLSDVYSLGATLYELLTGRPPFSATLPQLFAQVIHDDPPAPRTLVPGLPIDLETIALKCLAKDPAQRYPSARALADDLGRYLDGEPILGRRLSLWQRLRRRARRHRALVILGASALAIILAVASFSMWTLIRERARAEESTRLVEQLGREATGIQDHLREAYQWPLHDTRRDREGIHARMSSIAATHHNLGNLGDGIVHDALGRGHLALHEWREAADQLELAEAAGRQTPELHAARGRALGELYRRALEDVRRSGNKEWLARRQQELAQQYLTPALAELAKSRASGEDAGLLEALIALYRRDFTTAEKLAHAVAERSSGQSEARKLAADAAYGAAIEAFDHGEYDAARSGLERAATLYAEASEIARSDASLYQATAETWLQLAEIGSRQGSDPRNPFEQALDAIERALRADPDDAPAYTTKSYVLLRWHRALALHGQGNPRPLLDRIAQAAARAVEIDPRDARTWTSLGNAHLYRGIYEQYHGSQGTPWWNRALDEFGKALAIRSDDLRANNGLGTAHRWLGTGLDESGRDPMPEYQAALRSYDHATAIDPQYLPACTNQVDLHTSIAEHDDAIGIDPQPAVDDAQRAVERCLAIDPNYYSGLENLARAQLAFADYLAEKGSEPMEALTRARDTLVRVEPRLPEHTPIWSYRLTAARVEATFLLGQGDDPTRSVATGRAALTKVLQLKNDSAPSYVDAARLDLIEAAWAAHGGNNSAALLVKARANAEKAVAIDHQLADAKLTAAEACLQIALAQRSRAVVDSGIAYVEQALVLNPRLPKAQTVRDALLRLRTP